MWFFTGLKKSFFSRKIQPYNSGCVNTGLREYRSLRVYLVTDILHRSQKHILLIKVVLIRRFTKEWKNVQVQQWKHGNNQKISKAVPKRSLRITEEVTQNIPWKASVLLYFALILAKKALSHGLLVYLRLSGKAAVMVFRSTDAVAGRC